MQVIQVAEFGGPEVGPVFGHVDEPVGLAAVEAEVGRLSAHGAPAGEFTVIGTTLLAI